jgi:hypothetical protein
LVQKFGAYLENPAGNTRIASKRFIVTYQVEQLWFKPAIIFAGMRHGKTPHIFLAHDRISLDWRVCAAVRHASACWGSGLAKTR